MSSKSMLLRLLRTKIHYRQISSLTYYNSCRFYRSKSFRYFNNPSFYHPLKYSTVFQSINHFSSAAGKTVQVPKMADSITEGRIEKFVKAPGDYINQDETIAVIETDKISIDVHAPEAGLLKELLVEEGATVTEGQPLCIMDVTAQPNEKASKAKTVDTKEESKKPGETPSIKSDTTKIANHEKKNIPKHTVSTPTKDTLKIKQPETPTLLNSISRTEQIIPMTRLRLRISERLKQAQNNAASLTTFNECDMSELMALRTANNLKFQEKHGIKFGFVSAFLYAAAQTLKQMPHLNGYISEDGKNIIVKNYVDISVAVATKTGLLVPVIRDCEKKTIVDLEKDLAFIAAKARDGKSAIEDMIGGTFTISNGGVFGSMLGTPILNPPQSSILGLHSIKERPIIVDKDIVIRPVMYLALTYDHRLFDGREAVTFLVSIKDKIEDPAKMLLNI